jgi:formate C-acetyltransferase
LLEHIRAKINHYIALMVEGSNICDIGHRDWAPVPLLSSFISDCLDRGKILPTAARAITFLACRDRDRQFERLITCPEGLVFEQQRLSFDELLAVLKANFATPEGEKVRAADQPLRKIR